MTLTLPQFARRTAARNPGRTTLTVGLVATASFLIVAMGAFRLGTSKEGTGGYQLLATTDVPVLYDLNTAEGRFELAFSDRQGKELDDWDFVSCRVQGGEDASCLNLYRPTQPRVIGLPNDFLSHDSFAWASSIKRPVHLAKQTGDDYRWYGLTIDLGNDVHGRPVVPVVLDANTATYSLRLSGVGSRISILDANDQPVSLEVVGLLKNSVLQGDLLISEKNFLRLFPDTGGYQFFLARPKASRDTADPPSSEALAELLESNLSDFGFDAVDARRKLASFLAVQNTYLSTFQSVGALGLLLGTVGLAVVQIRSVVERRAELALMRAAGFRRGRLRKLVFYEGGLLLLGGMAIGCLSAAIAVLPHATTRDAGIPWGQLATLLGAIVLVGSVAAWWATRAAARTPLLSALRGD